MRSTYTIFVLIYLNWSADYYTRDSFVNGLRTDLLGRIFLLVQIQPVTVTHTWEYCTHPASDGVNVTKKNLVFNLTHFMHFAYFTLLTIANTLIYQNMNFNPILIFKINLCIFSKIRLFQGKKDSISRAAIFSFNINKRMYDMFFI